MPRISSLLTFADCVEMLRAYAIGHGREADLTAICAAVIEAQDEVAQAHDWSFLERPGRVVVNARQTTGTITYDHTGGSSERLCTLSGATNPSWINDASCRIGSNDIVCSVESGTEGATTFTLDAQLNPGQDVAAGSDYVLYQRYVALPNDFRAFARPMSEDDWSLGHEVTLAQILALDRWETDYDDEVTHYAIAEVPDLYDQLALFIFPQQTTLRTIDFAYVRNPRPLRYSGYSTSADHAGTIAVTADSTAVTGTGTAFETDMVGAVFRIGSHANEAPTGKEGGQPYVEERSVATFTSTTSIALDGNVVTTRSGVKYRVTDPVDIGRVAKNAFLWCCRRNLAATWSLDKGDSDGVGVLRQAEKRYREALILAMGADNRTYEDPIRGPGAIRGVMAYEPLDRTGW